MVFDNDTATAIYYEWRSAVSETEKTEFLEEFLEECRALLEAITWKYSTQMDHEDLIQECTIKVMYAISSYDPTITSLHTFLTTVIINHCNTCVTKERRNIAEPLDLVPDIEPRVIYDYKEDDVIQQLICRNRQRFPSIDTNYIDQATEMIYDMSRDGVANKSKGIIAALAATFPINRHQAIVIYHSTLIYLRRMYVERAVLGDVEEPDEFSLLVDFQEYFGDAAYIRLSRLFAGTFLKLP